MPNLVATEVMTAHSRVVLVLVREHHTAARSRISCGYLFDESFMTSPSHRLEPTSKPGRFAMESSFCCGHSRRRKCKQALDGNVT